MKKVHKILSLVLLIVLLCSATFLASASVNLSQNIIGTRHIYDFNSHKFIPENEWNEIDQLSSIKSTNTPYDITIDGDDYLVKVIKCDLDQNMTNSIPYTHLDRVMSIANGQTETNSNSDTYKKTSQVSHTHLKKISFRHERSALLEVAKDILDVSKSLKVDFSKSKQRTNTQKKVNKKTETETVQYSIPSNASDCNGVDYYTYSGMQVYDVEVELVDKISTDNQSIGYTDVRDIQIYMADDNDMYHVECSHCGEDFILPYWDPEHRYKHVQFADGHHEHYCNMDFKTKCYQKSIMPYRYDLKTTMTLKYYLPKIYLDSKAWHKDLNSQFLLDKPVHMLPVGTEEIVCYQDKKYLFRVTESPLRTTFTTNLPGVEAKKGSPVCDGVTKTVEFNNETQITNSVENITTTNWSISNDIKLTFAKWLSLSYGATYSDTVINKDYQETEETVSYYNISQFKLPAAFEADYTGMNIMETDDIFTFDIIGVIIPYDNNGYLQETQKTNITFEVNQSFAKRFADPYNNDPQ